MIEKQLTEQIIGSAIEVLYPLRRRIVKIEYLAENVRLSDGTISPAHRITMGDGNVLAVWRTQVGGKWVIGQPFARIARKKEVPTFSLPCPKPISNVVRKVLSLGLGRNFTTWTPDKKW